MSRPNTNAGDPSGEVSGYGPTALKTRVKTRLRAAPDANEPPDLFYEHHVQQLRMVRQRIDDVVKAKARARLSITLLRRDYRKLGVQAAQAWAANRKDLADFALSRQVGMAQHLVSTLNRMGHQEIQYAQLQVLERQLAAKIEAFRIANVWILPRLGEDQAGGRISDHSDPPELVVRVQGRGQYHLTQPGLDELRDLEDELSEAVRAYYDDQIPGLIGTITALADRENKPTEGAYAYHYFCVHKTLCRIIALVLLHGTPVAPDELVPSAIILPPDTLTLEEVRTLLQSNRLLGGEEATRAE